MSSINRFSRGTGMFKCINCTRNTRRSTDTPHAEIGLCARCYTLSEIENQFHDNEEAVTESMKAQARRLLRILREKGGTPEFSFEDKL